MKTAFSNWFNSWWPWSRIKALQDQVADTNKRHYETGQELLTVTQKYEQSCRDILAAAEQYEQMEKHYKSQIEKQQIKNAFSEEGGS